MQEKWAIITGATAGIGKATAQKLAKAGYSLYLVGRREDRLRELAEKLKAHGGAMRSIVLDVRNKPEVDEFIKREAAFLSAVEILVNNAGLAKGVDKMQDASIEDWDTMIDTNVKGLLYLTRGLLPFMVNKKSGHIVNIGSVAGRWVYPGGGVYCASKYAVRAISEGLRLDLLGTNVRVTNIEPGMVNTEFSEVRLGDKAKAAKVYENLRALSADDIAETILWCVSRPAHVNIQELVIYPTDQASVRDVHRT